MMELGIPAAPHPLSYGMGFNIIAGENGYVLNIRIGVGSEKTFICRTLGEAFDHIHRFRPDRKN